MNAQVEKEEKLREVPGPLKALQGREDRAIGRYPVTLARCRNVEMLSQFTKVYEPMWVLDFEYLDQPGNSHSEFIAPYNSKGSKAYKLASGMHPTGALPEEIRLDTKKFAAFFEDQVGNTFEITLQPNKTGKRNIIGAIRPIDSKEIKKLVDTIATDEIPF